MTPCTGLLRLHLPILPPAKVGGGLRGIDHCSTARGMTYTWRKHGLTFAAAADKLPKDLRLDEGHSSLLSRQRKVDALLDTVKWDDKGLAVAIVQNVNTGAILMQGFANRDALATTISSCKATFYSRSRSKLWTKGETSSNVINIIYHGKPNGPTCHTGSETCYFSSVSRELEPSDRVEESELVTSTLYSLESTISECKAELGQTGSGKPSWTKKLLLRSDLLCKKIRLVVVLTVLIKECHGFS